MITYGPYSPIRQAGNNYFVAGQVGINPTTKKASQHIAGQTRQTLENLQALLRAYGLRMDDVVKVTIYLKNMDNFAAMNEVYLAYFQEPRPARACVEVAGLPKLAKYPLLIEIEAIAYKP